MCKTASELDLDQIGLDEETAELLKGMGRRKLLNYARRTNSNRLLFEIAILLKRRDGVKPGYHGVAVQEKYNKRAEEIKPRVIECLEKAGFIRKPEEFDCKERRVLMGVLVRRISAEEATKIGVFHNTAFYVDVARQYAHKYWIDGVPTTYYEMFDKEKTSRVLGPILRKALSPAQRELVEWMADEACNAFPVLSEAEEDLLKSACKNVLQNYAEIIPALQKLHLFK